jgi:prepilin-type N-terminal cleavage/methylation domain-containing protein
MRYGKTQKRMRHEGAGWRGAFGHGYTTRESRRSLPLPPSPFRLPRAVTLVEMLAVLFVISLLAVAALRALPGDDQRPRETARMIGMFLASAKANAQATGRPCGVVLRRSLLPAYYNLDKDPLPLDPVAYCTVLDQCTVPPPYAGDTMNVSMMAMDWTTVMDTAGANKVSYTEDGRTVIKLLIPVGEFAPNLVRYGDQIQLNGQGPIYTICWDNGPDSGNGGLWSAPPDLGGIRLVKHNQLSLPPSPTAPAPLNPGQTWPEQYNFPNSLDKNNNPDPSGTIDCVTGAAPSTTMPTWIGRYCVTCYLEPQNKPTLPWPKADVPLPTFLGNIPPVSFSVIRQPMKSAYGSLQLPARSGIDLLASGTETDYCTGDVAILFSPGGSVDAVYSEGRKNRPTETIYLTVGTLLNEKQNYADLRNIIISINPQSGVISTNEVAPPYFNAQNRGIQTNDLPPYVPNPTWPNQFKPDSPTKIAVGNKPLRNKIPLTDSANREYIQSLYYSRAFAREAQMMGGKR